jgi:hypothetical protein
MQGTVMKQDEKGESLIVRENFLGREFQNWGVKDQSKISILLQTLAT